MGYKDFYFFSLQYVPTDTGVYSCVYIYKYV